MAFVSDPLQLPVDGRQSETALAIARGTARLLHAHGRCVVSELPLPSGRRADLVALDPGGELWIVEIKSSIADFRADQKWQDYRAHCDRLFFATTIDVPCEIFPPDTGLIVADAFGAEFKCEAPEHKLPAATRKVDDVAVRPCGRACVCNRLPIRPGLTGTRSEPVYRGARLARIRCKVRRCMLSRRAVSETLRPQSS